MNGHTWTRNTKTGATPLLDPPYPPDYRIYTREVTFYSCTTTRIESNTRDRAARPRADPAHGAPHRAGLACGLDRHDSLDYAGTE